MGQLPPHLGHPSCMELINIDAADVPVEHHFGGGVYAKQVDLKKAGTTLLGHRHKYDHLSILARGSVLLIVDGESAEHRAPACLTIAAGKHHEIVSLEPDTVWYCVHAIPSELAGNPDAADAALIEE